MRTSRLQHQLDQTLAATRQRWVLAALSVLAVFFVSASMAVASDQRDTWAVVIVLIVAVGAAAQPDEHTALMVIAIVGLHWLVVSDDVASPSSLVVAGCLYVFHTLIALMAVTPHRTAVAPAILRRWLVRSTAVVLPTVGVWALVVIFDRRVMPGNAALSVLALVVLAMAAIALRSRSLPSVKDSRR